MISTQNLSHETQKYSVTSKPENKSWTAPLYEKYKNKTFLGYPRSDGKVGTENNWLVIPLVFCQNRNIEELKKSNAQSIGL